MKLYDTIALLRKNPEQYIGRKSVQRLYAFLNGYLEGHPAADDGCLNGFHEYVAQSYSMGGSFNWASIIEFEATGDHNEMELFERHFDDFHANKEIKDQPDGGNILIEDRTLHDLIVTVLKRPELYIGRCSVQRLYAFINGFLFENEKANDRCLDGFDEYVADCHGLADKHNWADVIALFSSTDQDEIRIFQRHFDTYTQILRRGEGWLRREDRGSFSGLK